MILIDYGILSISNMYQILKNSQSSKDISIDFLRHMVLNSIRYINVTHRNKYGNIVIACDGPKSWRRDIFPYYKANRKKDREKSGLDWNFIFECFNIIRNELKENMPYAVIHINQAEADDIIYTLSTNTIENVLIVSKDKDFKQLQIYSHIKQWNSTEKTFITEDNPKQYLFEHIARGDSSDGVPNILSPDNCLVIGQRQKPITSKKLNDWRTIDGHINSSDEYILKNFERNKKLVDLSEIPHELKISILDEFNMQQNKSRSKIFNYFITNKLKYHLENINDF